MSDMIPTIIAEPQEVEVFKDKFPVRLTLVERTVLEQYALGVSERNIALELGMAVSQVKKIVLNPDNSKYISDLVLSFDALHKSRSVAVLSKIIDAKLNVDAESYADLTKKDVVDLIVTRDNLLKEREKASLGTNDNSTYITLLQQLVGNNGQ